MFSDNLLESFYLLFTIKANTQITAEAGRGYFADFVCSTDRASRSGHPWPRQWRRLFTPESHDLLFTRKSSAIKLRTELSIKAGSRPAIGTLKI